MNLTSARRHKILQKLRENGEIRVDFLSKEFGVSEVSIRKDLAALENQGELIRRFGGAIAIDVTERLPATTKISDGKKTIARLAAGMVSSGQRVIIDSGRTTSAMVSFFKDITDLVVMTNSLPAAQALIALERDITVLMTGGTWDARSESFQGHLAEKMLAQYDFDWLFVGADGIDLDRGTTTFNELTGVSKVMADAARKVVLMAEASKLGRRIHNLELPWSKIDFFVTDKALSAQENAKFKQLNVQVIHPDG